MSESEQMEKRELREERDRAREAILKAVEGLEALELRTRTNAEKACAGLLALVIRNLREATALTPPASEPCTTAGGGCLTHDHESETRGGEDANH